MTDITDVFATDDLEPVEEVTEPATPEVEPEPEPTPEPDPWYKQAGFESEEAATKKLSALNNWERELNRKSSELGAAQKAQPPQPVAEPDDPFAELDPASAAVLKKAIRQEAERIASEKVAEVAPGAQLGVAQFQRLAEKEFKSFAEAQGIDPSQLTEVMDSHGMWPTEPDLDALNEQMQVASAFIKQQSFDANAERERIREELLKEMKEEGVSVKAVEPNKAVPKEEPKGDLEGAVGLGKLMGMFRDGKI